MRIKETVMMSIQQTKTIICNCCGHHIADYMDCPETDYVSIEAEFGYFAEIFEEDESHKIDVCEECYAQWVKTFKIAPEGFGKVANEEYINFDEWKKQ